MVLHHINQSGKSERFDTQDTYDWFHSVLNTQVSLKL